MSIRALRNNNNSVLEIQNPSDKFIRKHVALIFNLNLLKKDLTTVHLVNFELRKVSVIFDYFMIRGPFLKIPGNLRARISDFGDKCFLTEVSFG